jgi:hypothetical protein
MTVINSQCTALQLSCMRLIMSNDINVLLGDLPSW